MARIDLPNSPGIYKILNIVNQKVYIGSSSDIHYRCTCHRSELRENKHDNGHLQGAWNKYGEKSFIFVRVSGVDTILDLIPIEQYYIDLYKAANPEFGYNLSPTAGSSLGLRWSEPLRQRHSKKMKGRISWKKGLTKETNESIRIGAEKHTGQRMTPEQRRNVSEGHKGLKYPNKKKAVYIQKNTGTILWKGPQEEVIAFYLAGNSLEMCRAHFRQIFPGPGLDVGVYKIIERAGILRNKKEARAFVRQREIQNGK